MQVDIHPRALKHQLTPEQIKAAANDGIEFALIRDRDASTEPQRWGVIGFDQAGHRIELVVVRVTGGVLVIHANYLTKGFEREMRDAR